MTVSTSRADFDKALQVGRPPNITRLFPNSRALIVSGKVIDRALLAKDKSMTIAANGRNSFVIRGALMAAQRVDAFCNELNITVPVAIHADHYGIKKEKDIVQARTEIPSMFDAGITSIAIDASHMADDENLLANLALNPLIPSWAGLETEVGEIKGKEGLSSPAEALFLIQGLNAHSIFPDWIALNNGTTHGIEASSQGIQVDLTARIHKALTPYHISGAQHGTSGNSSDRLREIAAQTNTTKANVATALQMISWGLEVNDYGNALLNEQGTFSKVPNAGMSESMWVEMVTYAEEKGWKIGNYKNLNLAFENKLLSQPKEIRDRMSKRVEEFVYNLLVNVFNAGDTAPLAITEILKAGSYAMAPKARCIEDPSQWTPEKIRLRARSINTDKGPAGNFDD